MRRVAIITATLLAMGMCPAHSQTYPISSAQFARFAAELFESEDACASSVRVDYDALSTFMLKHGLTFDYVYRHDLPRFRDRVVKQDISLADPSMCSRAMREFGPMGYKIPDVLFWK